MVRFALAVVTTLWSGAGRHKRRITPPEFAAVLLGVSIAPVFALEAQLAWSYEAAGRGATEVPVLAAVTGTTGLLMGLVWPAMSLPAWVRKSGRGGGRGRTDRAPVWPLILCALYAFSVYVRGSLSVLDPAVLLTLLAVSIWTGRDGWSRNRVAKVGRRRFRARHVAAVVLMAVGAGVASAHVAGGVASTAAASGPEAFSAVQWTVPIASQFPLLVAVAALAWRSGIGLATRLVVLAQIGHLSMVLGLLPLVMMVRGVTIGDGVGEGLALELGDRQRAELLLAASQALLGGIFIAGPSLSIRGPADMSSLFVVQVAMGAMLPAGPTPALLTFMAAVYIGVAVGVGRDRRRLRALTDGGADIGAALSRL